MKVLRLIKSVFITIFITILFPIDSLNITDNSEIEMNSEIEIYNIEEMESKRSPSVWGSEFSGFWDNRGDYYFW